MFGIKSRLMSILEDYRRGRKLTRNRQLIFAPPGDFYSPLPNLTTAHAHTPDKLAGIDLNEKQQLELLTTFASYHSQIPFGKDSRYSYKNTFFGNGDAIMLYCMMRHHNPNNIIEVGSGYSSAVMLDTKDNFVPDVKLTFIEPFPSRLKQLTRSDDDYLLLEQPVQNVPIKNFVALDAGDILFIDSSHVSKFGSDVNYLYFHVLPALARGVLVHIHDIQYPFEYPMHWLKDGRAWNEAYLLRAFLQFNSIFKITFWNSFMGKRHVEAIKATLPTMLDEIGGSIWLQKM